MWSKSQTGGWLRRISSPSARFFSIVDSNSICLIATLLVSLPITCSQDYKALSEGRPSRLTPEKIQLLNSIGMVWDAQRGGNRQRGRYRPMSEYTAKSSSDEQTNDESLAAQSSVIEVSSSTCPVGNITGDQTRKRTRSTSTSSSPLPRTSPINEERRAMTSAVPPSVELFPPSLSAAASQNTIIQEMLQDAARASESPYLLARLTAMRTATATANETSSLAARVLLDRGGSYFRSPLPTSRGADFLLAPSFSQESYNTRLASPSLQLSSLSHLDRLVLLEQYLTAANAGSTLNPFARSTSSTSSNTGLSGIGGNLGLGSSMANSLPYLFQFGGANSSATLPQIASSLLSGGSEMMNSSLLAAGLGGMSGLVNSSNMLLPSTAGVTQQQLLSIQQQLLLGQASRNLHLHDLRTTGADAGRLHGTFRDQNSANQFLVPPGTITQQEAANDLPGTGAAPRHDPPGVESDSDDKESPHEQSQQHEGRKK